MRTSSILIGLGACLANALAVAGPREHVNDVAVLINDYYFDAQRAAKIAGELKREADAGEYDRIADPDDLAVELTRRLKHLDGHFNVVWEGAASGSTSAPEAARDMQPVPPADFEAVDRRANYGFRGVERLPGNIGYIDLAFAANIDFKDPKSPAQAAADGALALVRGADAVILDLRGNGGGSPAMVGYLVSAFVERGKDVYNVFHSRAGTESERPDVPYMNPMLTVPLYILTSARTASAAEAIAYTLQTCGRAKIVGERSAGAANPGMMFRTPQGFAIFVSTGSPTNPLNGRNWEGGGVQPDIETSGERALVSAQVVALEDILSGPIAGIERVDAQWALDALRASAQPYTPSRLASYAGTYGPFAISVVNGALEAQRGHQPPLPLVPLQKDVFYVSGEPSRRFSFTRSNDRIVALEVRRSRGDGQHFNRAIRR